MQRTCVLYFSEVEAKSFMCKQYGCHYFSTYANIAYYRHLPPRAFKKTLEANHSRTCKPNEIPWTELITKIPQEAAGLARVRCMQIVAEYSGPNILMCLNAEHRREIIKSLAFFYEDRDYSTCEWITSVAEFDSRIFYQMVYRIQTGAISHKTGAAFKRALVYAYQMRHSPNKVLVDNGVSTDILWQIRRAYEHIMFGRFSLYDVSNRHALLASLTNHDKYLHSTFSYGHIDEKDYGRKTFVIPGMDKSLVLFAPLQKPFPLHHYRGALELLSSCGDNLNTIYLDSRLDHHNLCTEESLVFDSVSSMILGPLGLHKENLSSEENILPAFVARINDFDRPSPWIRQEETHYLPAGCHTEKLLAPVSDMNYEANLESVICHIKDFLLCIISQNPMLLSAPKKRSVPLQEELNDTRMETP